MYSDRPNMQNASRGGFGRNSQRGGSNSGFGANYRGERFGQNSDYGRNSGQHSGQHSGYNNGRNDGNNSGFGLGANYRGERFGQQHNDYGRNSGQHSGHNNGNTSGFGLGANYRGERFGEPASGQYFSRNDGNFGLGAGYTSRNDGQYSGRNGGRNDGQHSGQNDSRNGGNFGLGAGYTGERFGNGQASGYGRNSSSQNSDGNSGNYQNSGRQFQRNNDSQNSGSYGDRRRQYDQSTTDRHQRSQRYEDDEEPRRRGSEGFEHRENSDRDERQNGHRSFQQHNESSRNHRDSERSGNNERIRRNAPFEREDRDVNATFENAMRGAAKLQHQEDRKLTVSNLNNPPRISNWTELALHEQLLRNLQRMGHETPREVQKVLSPIIMAGYDVIGQCETGGGKTAAFLVPVIQKVLNFDRLEDAKGDAIALAIIVAPTRELASQIFEVVRALTEDLGLKVVLSHGKIDLRQTANQMTTGCQILVGTAGRVSDHIVHRDICVANLQCLVLDEADSLLEKQDGHLNTLLKSQRMEQVLPKTQLILTSATWTVEVENTVKDNLKPADGQEQAVRVALADQSLNSRIIVKFQKTTDINQTNQMLIDILGEARADGAPAQQIVFVNRRDRCEFMARFLNYEHIPAAAMHSLIEPREREDRMRAFLAGEIKVFVCTDLLARGLDVLDLDRVILLDLPNGNAEHVQHIFHHRIGRVGRVENGTAYVILNVNDPANESKMLAIIDFLENKNGRFMPEWLDEYGKQARENQNRQPEDQPGTSNDFLPGRDPSNPMFCARRLEIQDPSFGYRRGSERPSTSENNVEVEEREAPRLDWSDEQLEEIRMAIRGELPEYDIY